MRLCLIAVAAALLSPVLSHADVLYSYVGAGDLAGTTFAVSSPDFLSPNVFTPVTISSDYLLFGQDLGKITAFEYSSLAKAIYVSTPNTNLTLFTGNVNLAQDGVYISGSDTPAYQGSTFTISGSPAAPVAVTPEPSSLALLGTGVLGVAGVLRKRLA